MSKRAQVKKLAQQRLTQRLDAKDTARRSANMSSLGADYKRQEMLATQKARAHQIRSGQVPTHGVPIGGGNSANHVPPAGGQGTKPGSSRDDTANKIANPPPKRREKQKPLRYPEDIGESAQDMIKFSALEYKPIGKGLVDQGAGASSRYEGQKSLIDIYLPIPQDINASNTAGWNDKDFDAAYAALFRVSKGLGDNGAGDDTVENVKNEVIQALQESGLMGEAGIDLVTTAIGKEAANVLTGAGIRMNDILARQAGIIINPNKELLFNNISLREFGFNFVFTARSVEEAETIKRLIYAFKKYSAPKTGDVGFFLASPDVFQISYLHNGNGEHPFLNKFKVAALKSVNVNYTGSSTYSTYRDGTPTHIIMSLAFSEIEPVYFEDFEEQVNDCKNTGY